MNGYLLPHEIVRAKPIKVTPNPHGYDSQRLLLLMAATGKPWASYLWDVAIDDAISPQKQIAFTMIIQEERRQLERQGLPCSHIDAARSLLVGSGIYELSDAGLSIPCSVSDSQG